MHGQAVAFGTIILTLVTACGEPHSEKPNENADEYEAELFSNTRLLDEDTLANLDRVRDNGELTFRGVPKALKDISEGAVVLAPAHENAPSGLLRFVTGVDEADGDLVLSTAQAPIQVAFRKLHVRFERTIDDLGRQKGAMLGPREQVAFEDSVFKQLDFTDYPSMVTPTRTPAKTRPMCKARLVEGFGTASPWT